MGRPVKVRTRTLINTLLATAIGSFLIAVPLASPASAGTCTTPGCGGIVRNANGTAYVDIANCWSGSAWSYEGETLPCATNGYTTNKYNAMWFLGKGQTSTDVSRYYYDTDAFRVGANCILDAFTSTGATFRWNRLGKPALWLKISNKTPYHVSRHDCY